MVQTMPISILYVSLPFKQKIPVENVKTLLESFPALRNTISTTSLIPWLRTHSTKRAPFIPPNFNGPQRYNYICLDQYQLF